MIKERLPKNIGHSIVTSQIRIGPVPGGDHDMHRKTGGFEILKVEWPGTKQELRCSQYGDIAIFYKHRSRAMDVGDGITAGHDTMDSGKEQFWL